jgi:hypothetical protein
MRDDFFSVLPGYPVAMIGGRWYGQATDFAINTKGAPMENTERCGQLRAAIEDTESHLTEGRLSAAGERLADAKGLAMHLCRQLEDEPADGKPLSLEMVEDELRARGWTDDQVKGFVATLRGRTNPRA